MNAPMLLAEEKLNPLVPPIPELVIGLIAFGIVFFFLWKKLLPNINKVLDERREAIEGGIEQANDAKLEAQQTLDQYKAQLAEARHEAARMRSEAEQRGADLIAEMRAEGQRQREEIIAAGHAQIEADRKQAAQSLRQDVGTLATELAGKLVGESLEDHARQSRTIDRFLDQLEEQADSTADSTAGSSGAAR